MSPTIGSFSSIAYHFAIKRLDLPFSPKSLTLLPNYWMLLSFHHSVFKSSIIVFFYHLAYDLLSTVCFFQLWIQFPFYHYVESLGGLINWYVTYIYFCLSIPYDFDIKRLVLPSFP